MRPTCAVCGNEIPVGMPGWFCSLDCDDIELTQRLETVKLAAETQPNPR